MVSGKMLNQVKMKVAPTEPEHLARLAELNGKASLSLFDYSTVEADTGVAWIDGRVIHKKTIDFGALPNADSKSVAHGISSLYEVIRCEASAADAARSEFLFLPHAGALVNGGHNIQIKVAADDIQVVASNNLSTFTVCRVTLYYTKNAHEVETIVQIASGDGFALFLTSAGRVFSCGVNASGQLGRAVASATDSVSNLGLIPGLSGIVQIAAGSNHSLFITSSGDVHSCGGNASGQLGRAVATGSATTVNLGFVSGLSGIRQISAGDNHSLFLDSSGRAHSCGQNACGQLGRTVESGSSAVVNLGVLSGLSDINQIAAGDHSLFLTSLGQVYSCGQNYYGQLGRSVANGNATTVNLGIIPGLPDVKQIAASPQHSLFVALSEQVYSCGQNNRSQLGRAVEPGDSTTVNLGSIPGLSGIKRVSASIQISLFLDPSGRAYSGGQNAYGSLGRAVETGTSTNVNLGSVPDLPVIEQVATSGYGCFFLDASGNVFSCGYNGAGQLGRVVANGSPTTINLGKIDFSMAV